MNFKAPKNTDKYEWTKHSLMKMSHYGLTAQRVLRVINNPQRKEEGVVKNTIAVMQPTSTSTKNGKRVWSSEIWAMYQTCRAGISKSKFQISNQLQNPKFQKLPAYRTGRQTTLAGQANQKLKIISAWRYPGVSPKNNPIPEEILRELAENTQE